MQEVYREYSECLMTLLNKITTQSKGCKEGWDKSVLQWIGNLQVLVEQLDNLQVVTLEFIIVQIEKNILKIQQLLWELFMRSFRELF